MKLICTVTLVNRMAEASGAGVNAVMSKPLKSVVQFRNLPDGNKQILVSTIKDVSGQRFHVNKVRTIRDKFVSNGMLTIEMNDPAVNIMLKGANTTDLMKFLATLRGEEEQKNSTASVSGVSKSSVPLKRARSPEISKIEETLIRKRLKKSTTLSISSRNAYPLNTGFAADLVNLSIQKINLKRIDAKILALKNLTVLDLSNNGISSIGKLKMLDSPLQRLILAKNQIERVEENLFDSKAFADIRHLDLRGNKLQLLPNSIVYLTKLQNLTISDNKIECLPFNMHFLRSLQTLKAQNNKLSWMPMPIMQLGLIEVDVSANLIGTKVGKWTPSHYGSKECPTLFELAQEAVLNQSIRNPDPNKAFYKLGTTVIPHIIMEFLNRAKKCDICTRMTVRCDYHIRSEPTFRVAQNVIGGPSTRIKGAICVNCTKRLIYQSGLFIRNQGAR